MKSERIPMIIYVAKVNTNVNAVPGSNAMKFKGENLHRFVRPISTYSIP